jgi:hypothetical protein
MRGTDDIREVQQPFSPGKVFGVCLLGPESFKSDLVFGLFTSAAGFVNLILFSVFLDFSLTQLQTQSA